MKKQEEYELKRIIADNFESGINRKDLLKSIRDFIERTYLKEEEFVAEVDKLKQLENILIARLPFIRRWKGVEVFKKNQQLFVIRWYNPIRTNTHPYEEKEIPLSDLNEIIRRNSNRLNDKTRIYR